MVIARETSRDRARHSPQKMERRRGPTPRRRLTPSGPFDLSARYSRYSECDEQVSVTAWLSLVATMTRFDESTSIFAAAAAHDALAWFRLA